MGKMPSAAVKGKRTLRVRNQQYAVAASQNFWNRFACQSFVCLDIMRQREEIFAGCIENMDSFFWTYPNVAVRSCNCWQKIAEGEWYRWNRFHSPDIIAVEPVWKNPQPVIRGYEHPWNTLPSIAEYADFVLDGNSDLKYFDQILQYIYTVTNNFQS